MKKTARGSCLCGNVSFEIDADADAWMEHCHCAMCRKAHGAPFITWIDIATADFCMLRGADEVLRYASSVDVDRSFCGRCGASLFWQRRGAAVICIAPGTLDDDPGCRPRGHIYVASRAPWVEPGDDLPGFAEGRPKS